MPDRPPGAPEEAPAEADEDSLIEEIESPGASRGEQPRDQAGHRGWSGPGAPPTTLVLVRHGVTRHTAAKRFSGGLGGDDPALSEEGRAQARDTADWLTGLGERVDAVVSSPVRRTRESARDRRRAARAHGGRSSRGSPRWSSASGTA